MWGKNWITIDFRKLKKFSWQLTALKKLTNQYAGLLDKSQIFKLKRAQIFQDNMSIMSSAAQKLDIEGKGIIFLRIILYMTRNGACLSFKAASWTIKWLEGTFGL